MIRLIQRRLIIPRGDTGSFTIPALASATSADIAVFTIFSCLTHSKIFDKIVNVTGDTLNFTFTHSDTVNLPVGEYVWDIKFYKDPIYEDDKLINGTEIDSYYAGYKLPVCEIRETGDNLLVSDDAPQGTLTPNQIDIINSALATMQVAISQTQANVEHYPKIENGNWYVWDVSEGEYVDTGIVAQGQNGADGTEGAPGQDGTTPSFSIGTVSTLLPTDSATASITGTDAAPILNLGIPQGQPGQLTPELEELPARVTANENDITTIVEDIENYTIFDNYPRRNGSIAVSTGKWANVYNVIFQHALIPVSEGDTVFIEAPRNTYTVYAQLLNDDVPIQDEDAPLNGDAVQLAPGRTAEFIINENTHYLYILARRSYDRTDIITKVTINGTLINRQLQTNINELTSNISALTTALNDKVSKNDNGQMHVLNGVRFYIDRTNGDDINGEGTEQKPWKTLNKFFSEANKISNGRVDLRCYLMTAGTYVVDLNTNGIAHSFNHLTLHISGQVSGCIVQFATTEDVKFYECHCNFNNITIQAPSTTEFAFDGGSIAINNCIFECGIVLYSVQGYLQSSSIPTLDINQCNLILNSLSITNTDASKTAITMRTSVIRIQGSWQNAALSANGAEGQCFIRAIQSFCLFGFTFRTQTRTYYNGLINAMSMVFILANTNNTLQTRSQHGNLNNGGLTIICDENVTQETINIENMQSNVRYSPENGLQYYDGSTWQSING